MGSETTPGAGPSSCLAGDLTAAQRDLVIRHLPLNVTVSDEEGTLVYWHGDLRRILPQTWGAEVVLTPGVDGMLEDCDPRYIGRHLNECHNKRSHATIARMDKAFREGAQQEAVFRRLEAGRLILVRYCPLRDGQGTYRGMMETMQDITDIRQMDGEKLVLDW